MVSTSWEMEFKRNDVDLIWNELLFLLFNELLFFLLPNQKSTTTSNKHIPVVTWIFRFETVVPGPNPRLGAGLILDGFGFSKPSRIWGWYACVTYTFNIYSYVIYQSNCPHLASFFFSKSDLLVNICVKTENERVEKAESGEGETKTLRVLLQIGAAFVLMFEDRAIWDGKKPSYATALTPGWSGVESTVHRPGLGMKLSPAVLR